MLGKKNFVVDSEFFSFVRAKSLIFGKSSQIINFSLALFASLQLQWVTTTDRLLCHATSLLHEDGGIPLSVLPSDTSKLADFFSITIAFLLSAKQGSCKHHVLVFWYYSPWEMNLKFTDWEADALTAMPSHRLVKKFFSKLILQN